MNKNGNIVFFDWFGFTVKVKQDNYLDNMKLLMEKGLKEDFKYDDRTLDEIKK